MSALLGTFSKLSLFFSSFLEGRYKSMAARGITSFALGPKPFATSSFCLYFIWD